MDIPTGKLERQAHKKGFSIIAGIDEAGRGPLAGPVVAAAVIWKPKFDWDRIRDSKAVPAAERQELALRIAEHLECAVGVASVEEIDEINILQATYLAMRRAVEKLPRVPDYVLVDGCWPNLDLAGEKIVRGDALSQAIAAASLLAKVHRDQLMVELHQLYPQYGFAQHKGYGTPGHMEALRLHGPCSHHRRSFAPVLSEMAYLPGGLPLD